MADEIVPAFFLVTPAEVLDAMGENKSLLADATPKLAGAITRATIRLEGYLNTSFKPRNVVDQFVFPTNSTYGIKDGMVRFLLTNGCLRNDVDVVVSQSNERKGTYAAIDTDYYEVDRDRGLVQVDPEGLTDQYIRITYASGYLDGDDIPEEIQHAILLHVPKLILSVGDTPDPKTYQAESQRTTKLEAESENMTPRFSRRIGNVIKPVSSSYTTYEPA
jgi:hypothetical protein